MSTIQNEADLAREAARLHRADPFRRRRNRMIRAVVATLAITVALLLAWLFVF
ncbi:MAG: hypothetical protein ACJ76O_01620 [Gaiellaceae bacterium]